VTEDLDAELVMHVKNTKLFVMSVELNWGAVSLLYIYFFIFGVTAPSGPGPPHSQGF
jgi:hypothetical protein